MYVGSNICDGPHHGFVGSNKRLGHDVPHYGFFFDYNRKIEVQ
jgi:hypothetical protein